jgi:hypothetical protein
LATSKSSLPILVPSAVIMHWISVAEHLRSGLFDAGDFSLASQTA